MGPRLTCAKIYTTSVEVRLAHHLHQIDQLEPWYSPCVGVRALRFALHVKPLSRGEWIRLLALRKDALRGRSDGTSFVLSRESLGHGAEARWASESMEGTMPAMWKAATCGQSRDVRR